MPRPVEVVYTVRAAREIEAAHTWWRENRSAAPNAFVEELERAIELLKLQPAAGAVAIQSRLTGARRVLLPRVRYHVYYRYDAQHRRIDVLALSNDSNF